MKSSHQTTVTRLTLVAALLLAPAWSVAAQTGSSGLFDTLQGIKSGEKPRVSFTPDGAVRFVGAPPGRWFAVERSTADADDLAPAFLDLHGTTFGVPSDNVSPLGSPRGDKVSFVTKSVRSALGRTSVRLDQLYDGVPVFGAQALVQVGSKGVEAALLDLLRDASTLADGIVPELTAQAAEGIAGADVAADFPGVELAPREATTLVIFAPEVLDMKGPPRLSWQVSLSSPLGRPAERLLVDARDGTVLLRYSLAHSALQREVFDAQMSSTIPAVPARAEGDPATGISEVDKAYDFAEDTYLFYLDENGRDSIDDAGLPLESVVRFCPRGNCFTDDAFWDGSRSFFTEGLVTDDIMAHEITHGVTAYTSDLIYLRQSGAINESMSDIWGEFVDLTNGVGNDYSFARWLIGEDSALGAIRDMANPPAFAHPDSTCHPSYFEGDGDNGGVHVNSGILNKLAYLLVDGDTFNGFIISGMGIALVADLFYECQNHLLVPGSNFIDFYHAMTQATLNLGLDASQRTNVDNAMRAVNIDPDSNCKPPPPLPQNGECADALPITYGEISGHTTGATLSSATTCAADEASDVWYVFSATVTETVTFSTCSRANFDTSISVFDGCGASRLVCNDDDLTCTGLRSSAAVAVSAGTDYYVRVSGFGGQFGDFVLTVTGEDASGGDGSCGSDLVEVYTADFETDLGGFATSGLWHRTDACRALDHDHPSDYAVAFADDASCDYDTGQSEKGYATTPPLDLTTAAGLVTASFDDLLSWSGTGEIAAVEVTTDAGTTWTTLLSTTAPPFLFPATSWSCVGLDLSEYAGEIAQLRFGFDTAMSSSSGQSGFYLDNLRVEAEGFQGEATAVPCEGMGRALDHHDFEHDDEGYALTGLWHRSAACAALNPSHASEHGLYFGKDDTCTYDTGQIEAGTATSPPIDLTETSGLVLLDLRYHLETQENNTFDLATVEISDDSGQNWFELASNAGVPTLGDGGGLWKCGTYNISAYAGRTVQIRLGFNTVFAFFNNFAGFYVDDVRISAPTIFTDGFESGATTAWSSAVD